ncbi:AI-2E family transporter [Thalassotalea nanhaiensis]|uniref:AI-2E family transporter n=1 Tax=Thalassotalea nanhaiensis TaxID=3065648 RepID=A0ABY9TH67_9GAMM|nr:AI-2E family transporter [Colwelliaceae bacterium SQ345]
MNNSTNSAESKLFSANMIDAAIKIIAIMLIGTWCFDILRPFIMPMAWGAIIATALFPFYTKMVNWFGGKKGLAATVFALVGISILVIPTVTFSTSAVDSITQISEGLQEGTIDIPAPDEKVKEWPLVGEKIYPAWLTASDNLEKFASQYSEQIKNTFSKVLGAAASFGGVILQFILSVIIASMFLANSESCTKGCHSFISRLMGDKADAVLKNTVATVRSVGAGILGIAFTQAVLSGIGLVVADIPAAGVWVLLVLMVAIVQLPPIIILGPIAAYYFSVADTTPAVIFLVYSIVVSSSDAVLKPIFLGRGTDIPMLVILLGAIGGMIVSGIIGLFTGAVILALGYQLMMMWLEQSEHAKKETAAEQSE